MATKEELFNAVRLIKEHCKEQDKIDPISCVRKDYKCPLWNWCFENSVKTPNRWPDPEEGGGEDG